MSNTAQCWPKVALMFTCANWLSRSHSVRGVTETSHQNLLMTIATTRTNTFAQAEVTGPKNGLNGPKLDPNIQTTFLLVGIPVGMIAAAICRLVPKRDMCDLKMLCLSKYAEQCWEHHLPKPPPNSRFQTCSDAASWKAGWTGQCNSACKSLCRCSIAFHFAGI